MEPYLAITPLCDHDHPAIRQRVAAITAGADTPREKARRIFYDLRDTIRFSLAYSRSTASQTLKRGYGECGSKSNLHVAMLRAAGIPARLRWVKAKSAVLHHLVAGFVYRGMPATASHFWPECYLEGRWLSCEALLDRPLYEGMLAAGLITRAQIPSIDWDGQTDLVLLRPWITEYLGTLPSLDEALARLQASDEGMPPAWLERLIAPFFYPFNLRYTERIRRRAGERSQAINRGG